MDMPLRLPCPCPTRVRQGFTRDTSRGVSGSTYSGDVSGTRLDSLETRMEDLDPCSKTTTSLVFEEDHTPSFSSKTTTPLLFEDDDIPSFSSKTMTPLFEDTPSLLSLLAEMTFKRRSSSRCVDDVQRRSSSVLFLVFSYQISDQLASRFSSGLSLPQICENLTKAAYDPRIASCTFR